MRDFTTRKEDAHSKVNKQLLAEELGMDIVLDIHSYTLVKEKRNKIPYLFAKEHAVLPLEEEDDSVIVAVSDPLNITPIDELRLFFDKNVTPIYCSKKILDEAIELCYHQKQEDTKKLFSLSSTDKAEAEKIDEIEGYDLLERSVDNAVIQMLNAIIIEAIQQGASDIHFEPKSEGMQVRYRIDGILLDRFSPPKEHQQQILTRIKVMAQLDIAEKRLPQDGRIKLKMGKREIDFRVSTIPVIFGERIVLRILDRDNIVLGLDSLGMSSSLYAAFSDIIHLSEGIILVTGPTGSGKTTTLYSAISDINSAEMNIMTIEDPVEYKLSQISQIAVNPKIDLTFAKGLRHILRQDPDVIMIGEIRDKETAEIAIQSSLTGHLVFSTLHTNDAPAALPRLVDMGIEPYLLASSIVAVLAQRLVRKICSHCKVKYRPELSEIKEINLMRKQLVDGNLYRGEGCSHCFGTGYRGRHGIYELMLVTYDIKKRIMQNMDLDEIRQIAVQEGMTDLYNSGADLVVKGITTTSELLRITKTYN
jgi:general secretion pathway protein E